MTPLVWSTACPDWEERIINRHSLVPFDPLFPAEADAALAIFRELVLVDVAGRPTIGEACLPWVFDLPRALFGAYEAESGRRLIRYFFEFVSKKNIKSTQAAGIMLTALLRNWRDSGEYYILAPTKEVADNSFKPAWDMVRASEELAALLHVRPDHKTITHRNTGAFLKVVAADSGTVAGKKTIGLFIDELWLFGQIANADAMLREAMGGLLSRPEGFVIAASTQSDKTPAGIFRQWLERFRAIRDGKIVDNSSLPLLYEFPERMLKDGSYREPKNWYITNPNLGHSVDEREISKLLSEAGQAGKAALINAEAKFLNVEVGVASAEWSGGEYWIARADKALTLDALIARCEVATIGIDGGGLDDLLGLAVIGRERETRRWLVWNHAYAHRKVLERRKDIAPALLDFEREGSLTFCELPDDVIAMCEVVRKVRDAGLLPEKDAVGLDPNNVGVIVEQLAAVGIEGAMLRRLRQGGALAPALWGLERKLADDTLSHSGLALMTWVVGNLRIIMIGNAAMVTKETSGRAKIDPFVATQCGAILMSWNPEATGAITGDYQLPVWA